MLCANVLVTYDVLKSSTNGYLSSFLKSVLLGTMRHVMKLDQTSNNFTESLMKNTLEQSEGCGFIL